MKKKIRKPGYSNHVYIKDAWVHYELFSFLSRLEEDDEVFLAKRKNVQIETYGRNLLPQKLDMLKHRGRYELMI
jgi:hypothetical protein